MITSETPISITTESELGIYETVKDTAVFMYRQPNGACFIRLKDGSEFVTKPTTIVKELYKCPKK